MKIHIVSRDVQSNQILARLGRLLTFATMSDKPDDKAQINLFFPYLEMADYLGYNQTKTAAWFTHKDIGREDKEFLWDKVAESVDLRLTSALFYKEQLKKYGPTELVTVPLDRDKFQPTRGNISPKPKYLVGTSGYVYPKGRKGQELIAQLTKDDLPVELIASGRGWPIKTIHYEWDKMQDFYNKLDIYVCTSLIEGIGYGPIEAMACGIPVVIPEKVGIFDELPDLENLHRYEAGNYNSFRLAVLEAIETLNKKGYNQKSLRGATARFTNKIWLNSHINAFENLLYQIPYEKPSAEWRKKAGVFYVAYGEPARDCAVRAIRSFKNFMPDIPVCFVSDKPLNAGENIFIENKDEDIGARSVKTKIYDLAPKEWEFILYLDADTEVVADISFLFELVADGFELVFCTNPDKYALASYMKRPDNVQEFEYTISQIAALDGSEILQFNGGVFSFRRTERTKEFFTRWHNEWQRWGARDQAALDRALYVEPLRVYVLGSEWNTVTRYIDAERTAGLLHYCMQARRWRGKINGRLDSSEAWAAVHPRSK